MLRRLSRLVKGKKEDKKPDENGSGDEHLEQDDGNEGEEQTSTGEVKQPPLAEHDSSILDLAFVMDCTGSMGSYIDSARNNIRKIVEDIVAHEKSNVRMALVEYRDHPPQDSTFVTRPHDFTPKVGKMKSWLEACSATGGGDEPEAVADALFQLLKLSWRDEATKIAVLIADAPPHGLGNRGDEFPNGCPSGIDPMKITAKLAKKGVTLYVVGCEPSIKRYKNFFVGIAYKTGGQYLPLAAAKSLSQIIIGGAREEISLEQLMADVDRQVQEEIRANGAENFDETGFSKRLAETMASRGVKTKRLERNNAGLKPISHKAKDISIMKSLTDVRAATEAEPDLPRRRRSARLAKKKKTDEMDCESDESDEDDDLAMSGSDEDEEMNLDGYPIRRRRRRRHSSSASEGDEWECASVSIKQDQVERMVHKSKMRNKKTFFGYDSDSD